MPKKNNSFDNMYGFGYIVRNPRATKRIVESLEAKGFTGAVGGIYELDQNSRLEISDPMGTNIIAYGRDRGVTDSRISLIKKISGVSWIFPKE